MPDGDERKQMYMDKDKTKQYHGYLALPRHSKLLRQDLGYRLFSLYIALIIEARWFRGNQYFRCVVGTQTEIATRLGISQAKLSRGLNRLETKDRKYVIKRSRYILLGYLPLFLTEIADKMHSKNYANLHDLYADMYRINAELQENYAKSQEKRGQNNPQRLYSSSNVDLGYSDDSSNEINNDEIDEALTKANSEKESEL